MRVRAIALAGAFLVGATAGPALAHTGHDRRPGATKFDLEVKLSRPQQPAYDPHVVADSYGNLFAVARKQLPVSGDDRADTKVRASSWRWWSSDGGATWQSLPATAEADSKAAGLAPDVAVDGAGHVYVVDSNLLLRYTATSLGHVAFDTASAVPLTGDPRVAARGDGTVFVLASATVHTSHDGGRTFAPGGVALSGATDCRLASGPGHSVYAACLDGNGNAAAYVSHDDAASFAKQSLGPSTETPAVAVTRDGTPYVLRGVSGSDRTALWLSRGNGSAWTTTRATDDPLLMHRLSLTTSPDGRLGAAMYISAGAGKPWFVGAGIFAPAKKLLVVSFADHTKVSETGVPDGDTSVTFLPDSRLAVTWTVENSPLADGVPALRDAWFVRSQKPDARSLDPNLARTPHYEIPPCSIPGQVRQLEDWQAIRAPEFRARDGGAGAALVAYAVDPYDPRVVYVTNGTSLMRSDDGGCRWREVWSLEASPSQAIPVSAATGRVVTVAVPEDRREHTTVLLVVDADQPHVLRSPTGEPDTFTLVDNGLPAAGTPGLFRVSGANPDFLYLTVDSTLYATDDAGANWSSRAALTDLPGGDPITALAVDPGGPNNLYAVVAGKLRHSRDGGRTWDAPVPDDATQQAAGDITAVDVFHGDGGALPAPTAWSAPAGSKPATVLRSTDDGKTWTRETGTGLEGPVESAVHGSARDVLVVSTLPENDGHAEISVRDRKTKTYTDLSPVETTTPFRVATDRRGHPTFYGMSPQSLFRYSGDAIEPPVPPGAGDDSVFHELSAAGPPPVVTPSGAAVTLDVGSSTTLPFTVDIAARKPRIDVMFVSDTSESMERYLPTLRPSVLAALARLSKVADLWVGIAQDKTDQAPPVFRRERDVGPLGPDVGAAMYRLDWKSSPGLETQLIGLDQIVTGRGLDACPATTQNRTKCLLPPVGSTCEVQPESSGCAVKPGQDAHFRDDAVRFVLDATDTTFRKPAGTPTRADGSVDIAGVAGEYRDAGVLHVGLAVDPEGIPDLALMSRLTGAVAPERGLDCDGDGRSDVPPGAPAVCHDARRIDEVLLALAHVHAPLTHVHVEPESPSPALAGVAPGEFEDLDLTVVQHLVAHVTVTCPAAGVYDLAMHAEIHDESETPFTIQVNCVLPLRRPQPPRLVGAVPVVPPIAPVPPAQPLPNVNPNAQPQVEAQPQVGVARQQRDQTQLNVAEVDPLPRDDPFSQAARQVAGALGLTAAAAYGLRRRTRTVVARR